MKNNKKTRNVYIAIFLFAAVLFAGGWLYLSSQKTALEIAPDKGGYFPQDEPVIEIRLHNAKNANEGEIALSYSDSVIKLKESTNTPGVTMRELKNNIIFDLSDEFFQTNNNVVSTLTFEGVERGFFEVEFDQDKSNLKNLDGDIQIEDFIDARLSFGRPPAR